MDVNKECIKFYEKILKNKRNKMMFIGISEDVFNALNVLHTNVDFTQIPCKNNNELIILDDGIIYKDYIKRYFKSNDTNPYCNRKDINMFIHQGQYRLFENISKNCMVIQMKVHFSKRSRISVSYKIPINSKTFRHLERFIRICEMNKQFEDNKRQ